MQDNWAKIYETTFEHQAEIVCNNLLIGDIPAVIINKKDSIYNIGRYEVHVQNQDTEKAKLLIENGLIFE